MPGWISIARGDDHINFINQTWICHYMYYVNVYIYNYIYIRSCRTMILIDFQQVFVLHGSSTLVLNAHELNRAEVSPMG